MMKAMSDAIRNIGEFIDSSNRIVLTLNQSSYLPGEIVAGTVTLNCLVPFQARGVFVKVKGFEKAAWEETRQVPKNDGTGQTRPEIIVHRGKRHFFNVKIPVYPVAGVIQPGVYTFPFQYQLPAGLPGSFFERGHSWGSGGCFEGLIEYYAKANIDVAFKHDLKSKVYFVLNEKVDKLVKPSYSENSKTFLLVAGRLSTKVWLDKNVYMPGNTVVVKFEANNTSTKPTTKVNIKVVRTLRLNVGYGRTFTNEVYRQSYKGLLPMFYGVRWMPFQIPVNLQPSTTQSPMVQCSYTLVVECDLPGAVDLDVNLPVTICAPQWLYSTAPPPPPVFTLPPDVTFRPPWQEGDNVARCPKCSSNFGVFTWRHHCRHCAQVFCKKCLPHKVVMRNLGYDEPEDVCGGCMPIASQGGKRWQEIVEFVAPPPPAMFAPPAPHTPPPQLPPPQLPPGAAAPPPGFVPQPQPVQPGSQAPPSAPPMEQPQPGLYPPPQTETPPPGQQQQQPFAGSGQQPGLYPQAESSPQQQHPGAYPPPQQGSPAPPPYQQQQQQQPGSPAPPYYPQQPGSPAPPAYQQQPPIQQSGGYPQQGPVAPGYPGQQPPLHQSGGQAYPSPQGSPYPQHPQGGPMHQSGGYPPQQGGYPPQQQAGYPQPEQPYPGQFAGYPQQPGYPQQQPYAPQQPR